MSALTEYIEDIKTRISQIGDMNDIEIMRYVYIDLGRKMNFDLNYTFGNSKEKSKIYNRVASQEELSRVLETHTAICKSIAYLLETILKEFDIQIRTEKTYSKHVYNVVTLKNGEQYILDLEDDLEFIQSGAKTQNFGIGVDNKNNKMVSEGELREIDTNKVNYIPEGYYLEDMIGMLKKAVESKDISLEEKMEMVLQNLNVYTDNRNVKYREKMKYYERVIKEIFTEKEQRKIHQIDYYKKDEDGVSCKNIIVLENAKKELKIFEFSEEENKYNEISIEDLVDIVNSGYLSKKQVPGLRTYLKHRREELEL